MKEYYAYIMSSRSGVLYVGVSNDLERRVQEHKSGKTPSFTKRYRVTQLVWYESFTDIHDAIACEKRIKGWVRAKKMALIREMNPGWKDLSEGWFAGSDGT